MNAEERRALYLKDYFAHRDEIDERIQTGIEKNRKADARIRITDADGRPLSGQTVHLSQKNHEFLYGANLFLLDEFGDAEQNRSYREQYCQYFNAATLAFYWEALEPTEGHPRFAADSEKIYRRPPTDLCVDYCLQNGVRPKLHCLVYDKFIPAWVKNLSLEETMAKYDRRIRQIAERYRGKLFEFEVINEILSSPYWKEEDISAITHYPDVCKWAFSLARKYLPHETLVINDGNYAPSLAVSGREAPYYQLLKKELEGGADIDKIGMQHHNYAGSNHQRIEKESDLHSSMANPVYLYQALDLLAEFGKPLEITEITIPTFGDDEAAEDLQAETLKLLYSVWFSHPAVNTVIYWNTVDGYAYRSSTSDENTCRGGLWHHDLTPKKSALMLRKLFSEDWHTDCTLVTDADGTAAFRGFFGAYTVTAPDGTELQFSLQKDGERTFRLTL